MFQQPRELIAGAGRDEPAGHVRHRTDRTVGTGATLVRWQFGAGVSLMDGEHPDLASILQPSANQAVPGMTRVGSFNAANQGVENENYYNTFSHRRRSPACRQSAGPAIRHGAGMMGGCGGGYGMGPGGMRSGPDGEFASLKLSQDQRKKVDSVLTKEQREPLA